MANGNSQGTQKQAEGQAEIEYVDGAAIAARILRQYPRAQRERLIGAMVRQSPELADRVREKIYSIDEIKSLTNQGLQTLVREVEHRDLVAAVATAAAPVKEKLLAGMSERKREMVLEDSVIAADRLEPSQVKEAQWRVLEKLEELKEKGAVVSITKTGGTWA